MQRPLITARELELAPDVILLDARASDAEYAKGHLAGARHAHLERDLSAASQPGFDPARGGRHPLPDLATWCRTVGSWGIRPGVKVVVYDDQSGAHAAARAWWMLRAIGHGEVAVLDGGYPAAVEAGLPVVSEPPLVDPSPPYPAVRWLLPTVDIDRVDAIRRDPSWKVLDVRSAERFRGETEPIDPVAGHIPGAVNLPFAQNLDRGRFRPEGELRRQYDALLGGRPAGQLVVHCGSGVTACHTLLALEAAGLPGAALYVGSWGEWCRSGRERDPAMPGGS
jgi:thiosulfate/3-mercaptopyruvate sulfurtransferase